MADHDQSIFITGTDTSVGKTFFTASYIRSLRKNGIDAVGFKPIECGENRDDANALLDANSCDHDLDLINPVWFPDPVAPMVAAARSGGIDFQKISNAYQELASKHDYIFIEGAGGWLVPLTENMTIADFAKDYCQKVIVVAANRLGVINHTLLTCQAIESCGMTIDSVILNTGHLTRYTESVYRVKCEDDQSLCSNFESIQKCLPHLDIEAFSKPEDCDLKSARFPR